MVTRGRFPGFHRPLRTESTLFLGRFTSPHVTARKFFSIRNTQLDYRDHDVSHIVKPRHEDDHTPQASAHPEWGGISWGRKHSDLQNGGGLGHLLEHTDLCHQAHLLPAQPLTCGDAGGKWPVWTLAQVRGYPMRGPHGIVRVWCSLLPRVGCVATFLRSGSLSDFVLIRRKSVCRWVCGAADFRHLSCY